MIMLKKIIKALVGGFFGPKKILWRYSPRSMRAIALTFDDGPHPIFTPLVLDQLQAMGAKATFFLIGECAEKYPEIVQRIIDEGHEVGCHTYSHLRFSEHTPEEIMDNLNQSSRVLGRFGRSSQLFRPPYGDLPWRLVPMLWRDKKQIIFWSIDSRDFELDSADEILARIDFSKIGSGDVFLFHDCYQSTVDVLPEIGKLAAKNDLVMVVVSKLFITSEK